jgi:hypothetical protein
MLCRLMCALLFLAWTAEPPVEFDPVLYCSHWRSPLQLFGPLFVSVPGLGLTVWQVLLLVLAPLSLLWPGAFRRRGGTMDAAVLVSVASIAVTFAWGVARGGSAYNAYYQLWRFLAALLVGVVLLSVIRNTRDLKAVGLTVLMAALVRATLAIYFYWMVVRGQIDPAPPYMTTHDDSLLFVAGLLVTLSWALARGKATTWAAAALVSTYLLHAIVLNNRRLAWIEALLVLVLAYIVLPRGRTRRRMTLALLLAAPVVFAYVAVGWNRNEAVFAPLRALSTTSSYEYDASTIAREEEIRNLLYTLWSGGNPLLGTGWGIPYRKVTSFYANYGAEWWQYGYLPHNSLLGVAVFAGLVGLCGIWLVVPVAAFLGMRGYRGATGAIDRAAAMSAVCILPAYAAQCYGDIGFQSFTCALVLGVAVGVAGKVSAWADVSWEVGRRSGSRVKAYAPVASLRAPPARPAPILGGAAFTRRIG